jgi:VCBS repeat-containing protein
LILRTTGNSLTITINGVNDAPVLTAPTSASYTDTSATDTFSNTTGTLSASDRDTGATLSYGISSGTTAGSTLIGGVTYDVSKAGTYGTLYVVSTGADKGKYVYVPTANVINALTANVTDTFTVSSSDGSLSNTQTLTVNITGVNDAPTTADKTITINEDTATLLSVSDFGFSDIDTGSALSSVKITSLASDGTLEYNNGTSWVAVTLNQEISVADITGNKLRFSPSLNENGVTYSTFNFTVNDGTVDSRKNNNL